MADFYGTAAGFKAYQAARGVVTWAATADADIQVALLIASEWLDATFAPFRGYRTGQRSQIRQWPRIGVLDRDDYVVPSDVVPREIEQATYEATARQLSTPGTFFKDYTPGKYKSVSISGAIDVEYAVGSAYDFQTQRPIIAAILANLLEGSGGDFSSLSSATSRV